jgi:hypothetical protein
VRRQGGTGKVSSCWCDFHGVRLGNKSMTQPVVFRCAKCESWWTPTGFLGLLCPTMVPTVVGIGEKQCLPPIRSNFPRFTGGWGHRVSRERVSGKGEHA